jgi:hypothetical protein
MEQVLISDSLPVAVDVLGDLVLRSQLFVRVETSRRVNNLTAILLVIVRA